MEKGALFSGDIRLAFPWNGQEICGGVGKISDGKWLPLILHVSIGPAGHFRSIKKAHAANARCYKIAKLAAKIAIREALRAKNNAPHASNRQDNAGKRSTHSREP